MMSCKSTSVCAYVLTIEKMSIIFISNKWETSMTSLKHANKWSIFYPPASQTVLHIHP